MAANTKIEWADHTFNPWVGCTKVSPACDHCYAEAWAKRAGRDVWGAGKPRQRTSAANWQAPLRWNAEAARTGTRPRVFCASLADVFDNEVPAEWRVDLMRLISHTPYLDWLLLTKRIGNAKAMLEAALGDLDGWPLSWMTRFGPVMPNVWLGATVVNQEEADRDIPKLLAVPAAKRFLSIEPMLGAIDLATVTHTTGYGCGPCDGCGSSVFIDALTGGSFCRSGCDGPVWPAIEWVIAGGESGPGARPMSPDWPRSLRDQCLVAGVPFFMKQMGGVRDKLGKLCNLPEDLRIREVSP